MENKGLLASINQPKSKLAQAMRLGISKHPKTQGSIYRNGHTCALGAAVEGQLFMDTPELTDATSILAQEYRVEAATNKAVNYLREHGHGEELDQRVKNPWDERGPSIKVSSIIPSLNDTGKSREEIADWLDELAANRSQ
jgi:hypothetical protein